MACQEAHYPRVCSVTKVGNSFGVSFDGFGVSFDGYDLSFDVQADRSGDLRDDDVTKISSQDFLRVMVMGCENPEQAACRTLFNFLIKFPNHKRLEAATSALQIVEEQLGRESPLYTTVKILQTVCLVHKRTLPKSAEQPDQDEEDQD